MDKKQALFNAIDCLREYNESIAATNKHIAEGIEEAVNTIRHSDDKEDMAARVQEIDLMAHYTGEAAISKQAVKSIEAIVHELLRSEFNTDEDYRIAVGTKEMVHKLENE